MFRTNKVGHKCSHWQLISGSLSAGPRHYMWHIYDILWHDLNNKNTFHINFWSPALSLVKLGMVHNFFLKNVGIYSSIECDDFQKNCSFLCWGISWPIFCHPLPACSRVQRTNIKEGIKLNFLPGLETQTQHYIKI